MDVRVVSIGALGRHPLWGERVEVRTGHATTTLIRAGESVILVDPGLPGPVVAARLKERSGLEPGAVTHVFVTSFRPDVWRGVTAFPEAVWLMGEEERTWAESRLEWEIERAEDEEARGVLERSRGVLRRFRAAPDRLAGRGVEQVDLFPLPGVTPGLTGLLVPEAHRTVLVCGDAVATVEHLERGQVLPWASDAGRAMESLREAVEIADVLVLGRDNAVWNPTRRPF